MTQPVDRAVPQATAVIEESATTAAETLPRFPGITLISCLILHLPLDMCSHRRADRFYR